jgi:hypothetical protein
MRAEVSYAETCSVVTRLAGNCADQLEEPVALGTRVRGAPGDSGSRLGHCEPLFVIFMCAQLTISRRRLTPASPAHTEAASVVGSRDHRQINT